MATTTGKSDHVASPEGLESRRVGARNAAMQVRSGHSGGPNRGLNRNPKERIDMPLLLLPVVLAAAEAVAVAVSVAVGLKIVDAIFED